MMKTFLTIFAIVITQSIFAQNGYVHFLNDSIKEGYLRNMIFPGSNEPGLEFWKSKKDKSPLKIKKRDVFEYAIKKDTFRVLDKFHPFPDENINFGIVEAKVLVRGKMDLLFIADYANPNSISTYTGGGLIPGIIDLSMGNVRYMYVLCETSNYYPQGIPANIEKFERSLLDFFPEPFLDDFVKLNGRIKYNDLPELVKAYNASSY